MVALARRELISAFLKFSASGLFSSCAPLRYMEIRLSINLTEPNRTALTPSCYANIQTLLKGNIMKIVSAGIVLMLVNISVGFAADSATQECLKKGARQTVEYIRKSESEFNQEARDIRISLGNSSGSDSNGKVISKEVEISYSYESVGKADSGKIVVSRQIGQDIYDVLRNCEKSGGFSTPVSPLSDWDVLEE